MFPTNDPHQKERRQTLRNNLTPTEKIIWKYLRGKQLCGLRFRRQFGIGPYILDFYCPEKKLCIEIDGESHRGEIAEKYDRERTLFLNGEGIQVLRYSNLDVHENKSLVIEDIISRIGNTPPNLP